MVLLASLLLTGALQVGEPGPSEIRPQVLVSKKVLADNRQDLFTVGGAHPPIASPILGGLRLVSTVPSGASPWSSILHIPLPGRISPGDTVAVSFRAASKVRKRISVHVEMSAEPNTKYLSANVRLPIQTSPFQFAERMTKGFAPQEARLAVFLGQESGDVDLTDLEVLNLGPADPAKYRTPVDVFGGDPNPEDWRPLAEARIEKLRKGNLRVEVVDGRGKAIPNAMVKIEQVRHAFRFGTAAPADRIAGADQDSEKFREVLKRLFNTVTFENDLKWFQLAPRNYDAVDKSMEFLAASNFDLRGHCLVWGSQRNMPKDAWALPDADLRTTIQNRVVEMAARFKGKLYLWDVINEAATERELWDRLGWDEFANLFKRMKAAAPGVQLAYNDFNWTEEAAAGSGQKIRAIEIVKQALAKGAPIDVIGLQCHVGVPLTPVKRVLEIVDEIAKLGKPMEVTEFDIGGVTDPVMHAKYTEDYLTAMFSHPKVQSFILWGFWEGAHWRASEGAAMFKRDWTPTPTAETWERLVKQTWWTRANLAANARGALQTRVFYGTHRVTIDANGRKTSQEVTVPQGRNLTAKIVVR